MGPELLGLSEEDRVLGTDRAEWAREKIKGLGGESLL